MALPITEGNQMPALPIPKPKPREIIPLTEPVTQSQGSILPQQQIPNLPKSPIQPTPADTTSLSKPKLETRPVPPYPEPYFRPPARPPDEAIIKDSWKDLQNFDLDRRVEFEENSPNQEGIISETYERPDASLIHDPPELQDLVDTSKLIQKFLPKQVDIDKILNIIRRKVLKGTHLPLTIKKFKLDISQVLISKMYIYT